MKISEISQNIKKSKKYLLILSIFFIIFTFYFFTYQKGTNTNLTLEIGILTLLYITSAITIIYSQTKKEIHKIAFIIILLFGLFCVFLNPVMLIPDEAEHYLRSDLATYGDFEPQSTMDTDTSSTTHSTNYSTISTIHSWTTPLQAKKYQII